jgi:hypothetical protein
MASEQREAFCEAPAVDDDLAKVIEGLKHIRIKRNPPVTFDPMAFCFQEDLAEIAVAGA